MLIKLSVKIVLVMSKLSSTDNSRRVHFETCTIFNNTLITRDRRTRNSLPRVRQLVFLFKRKEKLLWIKEDTKHSVVSFHIPLVISGTTFTGRKNHYFCPILSHECMGRRALIHDTTTIGDRFIDEAD